MLYGMSGTAVAETDPQAGQYLSTALLDRKLNVMDSVFPADSYEKLRGRIDTIPRPQQRPQEWNEARPQELSQKRAQQWPQTWMTGSDAFQPSIYYMSLKAVLDFIGALFLSIVSAPIMAAVAIAIKLTSAGPVLFQQVRVGQHGKDFVLYKFRSMPQDVEAITGPVWSGDGDSRATPLGYYLRKFHLDELPQVINVLRGEMSLVGPRPERRCFVSFLRRLIPDYDLRHSVKPGITGLAQVYYPYGASVEDACEKLRYELYYARHICFGLDLRALAKTVNVVLAGHGQ